MGIFKKCEKIGCESDAEYSCSCSLLVCNHHLHEHLQQESPRHKSSSILLPLNHKELYLFTSLRQSECQISKEIARRNKKIQKLMKELKELEREYSFRIEKVMRLKFRKDQLLLEIKQKKKLPLVSDCDLAISLANLKKQNKLTVSAIHEVFNKQCEFVKESNPICGFPDLKFHLELKNHSQGVEALSISPCSQYIASGSRDTSINIWEVKTGKLIATMNGHKKTVQSLSYSDSNSLLVSASNDTTVKIWDLENFLCLSTYTGHSNCVMSAVFSIDTKLVASASYQVVHLWKTSNGHKVSCLKGHTDWVNKVVFMSDDKSLVSASSDKTIKIWDIASGNVIRSLLGHSDAVWTFAVYKHLIASGSNDNNIKVWNHKTGKCINTLNGHSSAVYSIKFAEFGNLIISGSKDKSIKIWSLSDLIKTIPSDSIVDAIQVAGKLVVSGHRDSVIKLWKLIE